MSCTWTSTTVGSRFGGELVQQCELRLEPEVDAEHGTLGPAVSDVLARRQRRVVVPGWEVDRGPLGARPQDQPGRAGQDAPDTRHFEDAADDPPHACHRRTVSET